MHRQGERQFAYNDWLAARCGDVAGTPPWRYALWDAAGRLKHDCGPAAYRDSWDEEAAAAAAAASRAFKPVLACLGAPGARPCVEQETASGGCR